MAHNENHAISLQDNDGRYLLSTNRFVYTIGYRHLFKDFEWAIGHASESFRGLHRWLALSGYEVSYAMVIRKIPNWINSQLLLYGASGKEWIIRRLRETPVILETYQDLHIPIFWMKDVIAAIDENKLDFENYLSPLSTDEIKAAWDEPGQYISLINSPKIGYSPKKLRIGRFIQYIAERNSIKRTSLVRSVGSLPLNVSKHLPILGKRIRNDYNGIILNNAKLKI